MRTLLTLVALGGFSAAVLAQDAAIRKPTDTRRGGVSFHAVSPEQQEGYSKMTDAAGAVVYVATNPLFNAGDLQLARVVPADTGTLVEIMPAAENGERIKAALNRVGSGKIAVLEEGRLVAAGPVRDRFEDGRVTLSGFDAKSAERTVRAITRQIKPIEYGVSLAADQNAGRPGDKFLIDVFVRDVSNLRGYQVNLAVGGGESGQLQLDDIYVDSAREQYVFGTTQGYSAFDRTQGRMVNALPAGSIDRPGRSYLATFVYKASDDAKGEFRIQVAQDAEQTVFLNPNSNPIDVGEGGYTTITIR